MTCSPYGLSGRFIVVCCGFMDRAQHRAPGPRSCECRFGSGISSQGCLLDAAETTGVVTRKGSWYYYGEQRMAQGRDKTLLELAASAPMAECARPTRLGFMVSRSLGPSLCFRS